jgi:SAM-dependent methyltransferase
VWDRAAPTYGRAGPDHFSHFASRLIQFAPIAAGATVLDLACGTGALASAVTRAAPPIRELVAADLSAGMLRRTAAEIPQHRTRWGVAAGHFAVRLAVAGSQACPAEQPGWAGEPADIADLSDDDRRQDRADPG